MVTVAFDPGKMTGVALHHPDNLAFEGNFEAFALPCEDAMDWAESWIVSGLWDDVVCESIVITAQTHKKSQDVLCSVEQIGILRYLCRRCGVPFRLQTPAEAKSFGTDAKLKALGWWTKGLDHPRDATRHLILRLANTDTEFAKNLAAELET